MSQNIAQLMSSPNGGRVGAVKAGSGISIGPDGTICATGGGGSGVFSADADNNIWSCNTAPAFSGATGNFLVGYCAGSNLSGSYAYDNTFIGKYAGFCSVGAGPTEYVDDNNFIGTCAGYGVLNGYYNNFLGFFAGKDSDGNTSSNFIGSYAGQYNLNGFANNFIGAYAGQNSLNDSRNNFFGYKAAGQAGTNDSGNFIGTCAGFYSCGNYSSNFIGVFAGLCGCNGQYNNFIGHFAGGRSVGGCCNNFIGYCSGHYSFGGWGNDFTGAYAGVTENGSYNVYTGYQAGKGAEGDRLTSIDIVSATVIPGQTDTHFYYVKFNPPGASQIQGWATRQDGVLDFTGFPGGSLFISAFGSVPDGATAVIPGNQIGGTSPADDATVTVNSALFGNYNDNSVGIGNYALGENFGLSYAKIAIGNYAGQFTGVDNEFSHIFIGSSAGRYALGGFSNLFIGSYAGQFAGGKDSFSNTFIGAYTGGCAGNSFYQTFVGAYAGSCVVHPTGWTGGGNQLFGAFAGSGVTTGDANSMFGLYTGEGTTTGSYNSFFGQTSGCNNTTGSNNVAIGSSAGTDAVLNLTTQSNQIVIGNNSHTNAFIKVGWTVTSDERDKTCVSQISHGREFLQKLEPVQFNWKDRESDEITDEKPRYGFLAQQVLEAEGEPVVLVDDSDPENLKLRESMMVPLLFKIIQEMDEELRALRTEVNALRG